MPAVAQISVDFAVQTNITGKDGGLQTNTKAVGPLSLARYCLYNREQENFGFNNEGNNLSYDGGFLTAGDKINCKHTDLQIRQNLDIGSNIFVDNIFSRRKETADDNYTQNRASVDRTLTLGSKELEANTTSIKINSSSSSKLITLKSQLNTTENSISILSNSSSNSITINSDNVNFSDSAILKTQNINTTAWVKSMPVEVSTAILNRDYNNTVLTDNYNAINVRDLISEVTGTKPPVYWSSQTDGTTLNLQNKYDNRTIIINSATIVTVNLPSGLREGLQVSFVRAGIADVVLQAGSSVTVLTSPAQNFRKLAFTNSVATCLLANGNRYFLFGDLLPTT